MGNRFENVQNVEGERVENLSGENFDQVEKGFLLKMAENPAAKRMLKALAVVSGAMAFNFATPKESQAFLSNFVKDLGVAIQAPIREEREAAREYHRQIDRENREDERAQFDAGRAMAIEEINRNPNGPFTYVPMGRFGSDRSAGPMYQGYMSVMRPYLERQRHDTMRDAERRGRMKGLERYQRERGWR